MKVKIIATGEIKEVLKRQSYPLEYIDKEGNIYTCGEADRIWDNSIDWEQRRYEIAKEILPNVLCANERDSAKTALCYADELIKQLKGE